jgi:4'-phosphopantetheinyl transferase
MREALARSRIAFASRVIMRVIEDLADWGGEMPAILAVPAAGAAERRDALRRLVARVLYLPAEAVAIAHEEGQAPRLLHPAGAGLHLSSASRAGRAALAVGRAPLGIDIEAIEPGAEPPWNVLHPSERDWLSGLETGERGRSFARIWAGKEAYLKALGAGFSREPASVAVLPAEDLGALRVVDTERRAATRVSTTYVNFDGRAYAVALAELVG